MTGESKAMPRTESSRPNVVVLLADDMGPWAMGCAGNPEIRTPNLDRLAAEGTRLQNFFCVSPVCSAARASLLTGLIPSRHGILDWLSKGNHHNVSEIDWKNDRPTEYLDHVRGYSDALAGAGYVCGLSGKWHMGASDKPQKSFEHWFSHPQSGVPYYMGASMYRGTTLEPQEGYLTDRVTDDALSFIDRSADGARPFLCEVHYTAPHSPWDRQHHPAQTYDSYADCPFETCPQPPGHPWQIASAPRGRGQRRRELLQGYFAAITEMDRNIGRILRRLDDRGLSGNTLVLFTSDNGMCMGHHGCWGKGNATFPQNMYEESVRVPTILRMPGHVEAGRVEAGLYSHYDWLPTLLDWLGIENPDAARCPGTSFAPLLRGQDVPGRDEIVVYDEYGPTRMIRDRRWKYVHRYPFGPHELYDLQADPGETANLIDRPDLGDRLAELRGRLAEFFVRFADPQFDGSNKPVTGRGQMARAGLAGDGATAFEGLHTYIDQDGQPRPQGYHPPGV